MTTKSKLNRDTVVAILQKHKEVLRERFGVTDISLFGSFARDEATEESDIDVIVKFECEPSFSAYFGAQVYLQELFGRDVDLATEQEIRKEVLPFVKRDLMLVWTAIDNEVPKLLEDLSEGLAKVDRGERASI